MFRFEVSFWEEDTNKITRETGIVGGADYGAAANRVVEYYGRKNVIDIKLYELDDILVDEDECTV